MTEVVDTNTGSDISLLAIDFLRSWPCLTKGCAELGVKAAAFGVVGFDVGGVGLEENGGTGDGWELNVPLPIPLEPPGDGRGEGGYLEFSDGTGSGGWEVPVWMGWRCFE
jgi:hypothetical protein